MYLFSAMEAPGFKEADAGYEAIVRRNRELARQAINGSFTHTDSVEVLERMAYVLKWHVHCLDREVTLLRREMQDQAKRDEEAIKAIASSDESDADELLPVRTPHESAQAPVQVQQFQELQKMVGELVTRARELKRQRDEILVSRSN